MSVWSSSASTQSCSSPPIYQWNIHHHHNRKSTIVHVSSYIRRRNHTSKKTTKLSSDQRLEMVIDIKDIRDRASRSLQRFCNSTETKFNRFVSSGTEAFDDLRTIVTVDRDNRILIGCRRSSLRYLGNCILFVSLIAFGVWFVSGFVVFRSGYGGGFVWRRDRSLAGRQVVVAKKKKNLNARVPVSPLSPPRGTLSRIGDSALRTQKRVSTEHRLPIWWPDSIPSSSVPTSNKEFQEEANRVFGAIMDNIMSGKDITEDDIVQLRKICKTSGVRVYFGTANARDSFFRESVDLLLNSFSSKGQSCAVHADGEDAQQFVAGLANSIGLQNNRAATIVSGVVAARTRSGFLQAWALEMQGKRAEAVLELSKICHIHEIFPPEESSPEMEMVAQGLEKHLKREQRERLLNLLLGVCGAACRTSAAEALGLIDRRSVIDDFQRLTH